MDKGKILVVDDEPEIVKTVSLRLKANGYTVVTACDGMQATSVALKESPDLIILDIGMPAGDGHLVAKRLRESAPRSIPIIFLTAHTSKRDYEMAFDEGIAKYITKPFRPEELLAAVEELIERVRT
jgi:DNA-binding response OmpR family regulator